MTGPSYGDVTYLIVHPLEFATAVTVTDRPAICAESNVA